MRLSSREMSGNMLAGKQVNDGWLWGEAVLPHPGPILRGMRLNPAQIVRVSDQTGLDPDSEDHAFYSDLGNVFGHQTYYLVDDGLLVLRAQESDESSADSAAPVGFWRVASWADEDRSEWSPTCPTRWTSSSI